MPTIETHRIDLRIPIATRPVEFIEGQACLDERAQSKFGLESYDNLHLAMYTLPEARSIRRLGVSATQGVIQALEENTPDSFGQPISSITTEGFWIDKRGANKRELSILLDDNKLQNERHAFLRVIKSEVGDLPEEFDDFAWKVCYGTLGAHHTSMRRTSHSLYPYKPDVVDLGPGKLRK